MSATSAADGSFAATFPVEGGRYRARASYDGDTFYERCDRLAIINQGKLMALGTPAELKQEIGGDVILLDTSDAESLADRIRQRFHLDAKVLAGQVRIEKENGHHFIADVVEAFPREIEAISVSKPSLEDVFIRRTGHKFWTEGAAQ